MLRESTPPTQRRQWRTLASYGVLIGCMSVTSPSHAALDDYELSRLPASLANQRILDNGDIRVTIPSYINNNGILAGVRLTWTPNQQGEGITELQGQSGYLYDLNSNEFIARNIPGQAITHISDEFYISKRLTNNTRRWQSFRCRIDGLVPRPDSAAFDNPSCTLIDNDFLDQTPGNEPDPARFWRARYVTLTLLSSIGIGYGSTNKLGSSVVLDLPDEYISTGDVSEFNLYTASGATFASQDLPGLSGIPGIEQATEGGVAAFGSAQGQDAAWVASTPDPENQTRVYQAIAQQDGTIDTTSLDIGFRNLDGTWAQVVALSKAGGIITSAGTCTFHAACTDFRPFASALEISSPSPMVLNNNIWLAANSNEAPFGTRILDLRGPNPETVDPWQLIQNRFNETRNTSGLPYRFPITPDSTQSFNGTLSANESGRHIVVSMQTTDGQYRVYMLKQNTLPDFALSRLPAALARQVILDNGDIRVILPSYINRNGIMAGVRLTWTPANGGEGISAITGQSGYLYDLNAREFVARNVAGQLVTHIADDHYISKRLTNNTRRWRTFRCPISGLVARPGTEVYDNPDCTLIDNDLLDLTPDGEENPAVWLSRYATFSILGSAGFGFGSTNYRGSTVVLDLPDNYPPPIGEPDQMTLYGIDGFAHSSAALSSLAELAGITMGQDGAIAVFGVANDTDTAWASVPPAEGDQPVVYQVQFLADGSIETSSLTITQQQGNGDPAKIIAFTKDGQIITDVGICRFSLACADFTTFATPLNISSTSPMLLNNRLWVAANVAESPFGTGIVDMRGEAPITIDPWAMIDERFGETRDTGNQAYALPISPTNTQFLNASLSADENGSYIVVTTKTTAGDYRVYLLNN